MSWINLNRLRLETTRKQKRLRLEFSKSELGQSMVEFTLMLLIILALVVSMVHVNDLLNYDFWAQQEARYLAFEQTWVADQYYQASGTSPEDLLSDSNYLRRPSSVTRLEVDKDVNEDGGVVGLLTSLTPQGQSDSQIILASASDQANSSVNSLWHRKTSDWISSSRAAISKKLAWVDTAYASLIGKEQPSYRAGPAELDPDFPDQPTAVEDRYSLERGTVNLLEKVGFGEKYCTSMQEVISSRKLLPQREKAERLKEFSARDCGERVNREFAEHLAENIDIKQMYRDYQHQLEGGIWHDAALEAVATSEIANQFYSFFDREVAEKREDAESEINSERQSLANSANVAEIRRLITDMRYVGSSVAITAIVGGVLEQVLAVDADNRNPLEEKQTQDTINGILLADVPEVSYYLNPTYLPVPPTFLGGLGLLQAAAMENVLRGGQNELADFFGDPSSDESDQIGPLIEESNKEGIVQYQSGNGIFPAAARKFRRNRTLTSRFYLVTQPWHITRKVSPFDNFREIGGEFDGIGEETEEAVLRRRVAGLWLFPSSPAALFTALADASDSEELSAALDIVSGFDAAIASLKTILIVDNPINALLDALSQIPFIGNLVPTFPKFPSVRPASYPGSVELRDQENIPDDELMGEKRNFQNYLDEQDYNPPPKPKFDNDTFS